MICITLAKSLFSAVYNTVRPKNTDYLTTQLFAGSLWFLLVAIYSNIKSPRKYYHSKHISNIKVSG